mmetsp:Transcript_8174/g.13199  ORF Transcript_8174/g.13199 Transcript_8174/m.13199 type:complete len:94 (+) Transcript_8174:57-338(+)
MTRFFCDYCDMFLSHDSASGRREHIYGWKHRVNYRMYYENIMKEEQARAQQVQMPLPPPGMVPPPADYIQPPPGAPPPGMFIPGMIPPPNVQQ